MAKNIAGRILIMPRGTYDANATYEMLDLVTYNNASWLAKKTATGIEPADGEYWHKMADGVELVTNLTTEEEGKALDASMGKVLKDLIDAVGADALRERLNALEVDNVVQKDDIEALKLAIEALGNVDNATVRYVSDETDENFDWIQVQDAEGNWINTQRAYTQRRDLYMTSANEGNFEAYNGSLYAGVTPLLPAVTCGDVMQMRIFANNNRAEIGSVMSELIDLSRFKTLHLYHKSSSGLANSTEKVRLFITQLKETKMTAIAYIDLLPANGTLKEGEVEFDISAINGEYYIGIQVCANSEGGQVLTQTEISNFYLE